VTLSPPPFADRVDFAATERWPVRAAAHLLGIGLVLTVLIALPVAPTDLDRHQLPKETVLHLTVWFAVLLARPFPPKGLRPATWIGAGLLAAAAVISGVLATNGWLALRAGSLIVGGIASLFVARHLARDGQARVLLAWAGIAGIAGAMTGLAQAYGASSVLFATTRVPGGTFGNRNFMAHYCVLALPVLGLIALTARRRSIAVLSSVSTGVLIAAIVLTRSRAAWIGLAAEFGIFGVSLLAAHRRSAVELASGRLRILTVLLVAGVVLALLLPNRLAWKSASPYTDTLAGLANHDEGSGRGRMLQYRHTLALAARHPIVGVGPGNWPIHYGEVTPGNDPSWVWGDVIPLNPWPSSDWIALVSELGALGTGAVLLLGASILWRALRAVRSLGEPVLAGATLLAILGGCLIQGTFDAVLLLPAPLLLAGVCAGSLLQWCEPTTGSTRESTPAGRRAWLLAPLLLAVICLRSSLETAAYLVAGDGREIGRLSWAARLDPGSYPLQISLAQRLSCAQARPHILAARHLAPDWPAPAAAARRCGVR
jgi:hypothetical protein